MTNQTINSGVWGHSSETGQKSFIILSVDRAGDDLVTTIGRRHAFMIYCHQHDIPFKLVFGVWKGQTEISFVTHSEDYLTLAVSGLLVEQDAVLLLGPCNARDRRPATMHWLNGAPEPLGLFQSVSPELAHAQNAWTYDPTTLEYYAVLPVGHNWDD